MNTDELIGIGLGGAAAMGQTMFGNSQAQQNQHQQVKDQKELMELSSNLSYQNWLKTNYSSQIEQMKKAGLNVGMMYKNGGSGGTLGGASGGSASKADTIPMDVSSAISQNRAIESQIKLNEAQADKLNVESKKISGVDTEKVVEESKGIGLDNTFKQGNLETALDTSKQILANENAKNKTLVNEGKISGIEAEQREKKLITEINNVTWDTVLKKAQKNNVNQQTIESIERVKQKWEEIDQGQQRIDIAKFKAELQSEYPGVWNTLGKMTNDVLGALRGLDELFGFSPKDYHRKVK